MIVPKAVLVLTLVGLAAAQSVPGITPTEHFNYSLGLDAKGNYFLFWNANVTHVTFEVHVKTRGYVGFGLSPNGNMYPSDVVVGWVKDGNVYFKDAHTVAHAPPIVDASQDWHLLHGEENDFGTVLKFVRKIDTCDDNDTVIIDGTQRVIYSYHTDDPTDYNHLMYHGGDRRGTKSVSLLNQNRAPEVMSMENVKVFDFRPQNYIVPDKDTTYLCVGFQMPDLGGKHHMIEFEPIYTPGNEALIHHVVIQRCPGNHPALNGAMGECYYGWPKDWPNCPEIFIAWATGGGPYYFPSHTGYPVGGSNDMSFYVMQTHYDNPTHRSGVMDSSGIRMRLTPKLRQFEVGSFVFGHAVHTIQIMPPNEEAFVTKGYCASECVNKFLHESGVSEMRVMAALQHAHLLASGIKTRHFRNGTELEPIQDDPSYDFYFQEMRTLKKEVLIKKGDSIQVECTYNTKGRSEPSFGGLTTREEMCETLVYYYPKVSAVACSSLPDLYPGWVADHKDDKDFLNQFRAMVKQSRDWTNKTEKENFKMELQNANVTHICTWTEGEKHQHEIYNYEEQESDIVPFVPQKPQCSK